MLIFLYAGAFESKYIFKKLSNENGLTYNTINDILQEPSGIMWFATKQGLNRYDSYKIKKYYREDDIGIPSNFFTSLLFTSDDQLYAGTDFGLVVYNKTYDNFSPVLYESKNIEGIVTLTESKSGVILIGTEQGIYAYYPKQDKVIKFHSLQNEHIFSIVERKADQFLVATNSGMYIINSEGVLLEYFNKSNTNSLTTNFITRIYKDKKGNVWVGTDNNGLFQFNEETKFFSKVNLTEFDLAESKVIRDIDEDGKGNIWIASEQGIFILDPGKRESKNIQFSLEKSYYHLSDNAVYCLFRSAEDIMWIGTYFGGVDYTDLKNRKGFYNIYPGESENEFHGKAINKLYKDSNGILWIATENGGICSLDLKTMTIRDYYQHGGTNSLSSNNIHSICEDNHGNIWFGNFMAGIDILNPRTGQFRNVLLVPNEKYSIEYNAVYSIFKDMNGQLWIGARQGIYLYDESTDKLVQFKPDELGGRFIYDILEDKTGKIWFCLRFGGTAAYDKKSDAIKFYSTENGLSTNRIISATEDRSGNIWFGTVDGGVNIYHPATDSFEVLTMKQGLPNNTVYGILEAQDGKIWTSTNFGLSQYNPETKAFRNYKLSDGLAQMQFNFSSYFKDSDGTLFFGHIDGLTYFNPADVADNKIKPEVLFTDFKLSNKSVPITGDGILTQPINSTDKITLGYLQKAFTIEFVAVNHLSAGNNRFYCYLEGFEDDWTDIGNSTSATYTNLSPGKYTFWLKAKNNDGRESKNIKKLEITIRPPFYFSKLAFVFYILMTVGIFLLYRKLTIEREKEKAALNYEKMEKQKITELNQQRMNFYTYISHEFKTPLSIIISSIDQLFEDKDISDSLKDKFRRLRRSSKRLSFLFNQLMDFRKIETKHAKLVLQNGDIIGFIRETCLVFTPMFDQQRINFEFDANMDSYEYWFDPDKIEKIIVNLISNALKNTPLHGKITCETTIHDSTTENERNKLIIRIADTGIGISSGEIEKLFTPFYKYYGSSEEKQGSGIGLTLVKSLVEYLQGTIEVSSELNRETVFTIQLPLDYQGVSNIKLENNDDIVNRLIDIESIIEISPSKPAVTPIVENEFRLLIVEDTVDLSDILAEHYCKKFKVSRAQNGIEALKIVKEEEPDIIISDIMMPEMNGIDFCRILKQDEATSHIAVILLTAKTLHEDRLEGLKAGAEAYITKPFDLAELDLHVRNFLEIRKKLKEKVIAGESIDFEKLNFQEKDKEFIGKVSEVIHRNIENEAFNTELLAQQLGMSKTLVYLKLKKLLNMSGTDYIQLLRLKKAIELMADGNNNISEIAYEVGFSDPNYFSKVFKKTYKITPTEYRRQLLEQLAGKNTNVKENI